MTGVIVCSDLYPVVAERTASSGTFAVRELVEGVMSLGGTTPGVIRFLPSISRRGISLPSTNIVNSVLVQDVPRVGIGHRFSPSLTSWLGTHGKRSSSFARAELIIAHMTTQFRTASVSSRGDSKIVFVVHGSDIGNKYLTQCVRSADVVLARSLPLKHRVEALTGRAVSGVAYSGVSFPIEDRSLSDLSPLRIAVACSLIPLKNVAIVVQAVSKLYAKGVDVRLDIYGDGPLRSRLEGHVEDAKLSTLIAFHGFVSRDELFRALKQAELFIMPSAPETFGLAYLEAMAAGCVVVGHKGWGVDGIVKDGENGFLVEQPSVDEVENAVERYIACDRRKVQLRSRRTVEEYTTTRASLNYATLVGWPGLSHEG